ncbi:MAG: NlpC/P60 family protein [Gemmatimonadales bacterium]
MHFAIGRSAITPLRREPSNRAEQVSQVVLGETARILERRETWWRIEAEPEGYAGWGHSGYLFGATEEQGAAWRSSAMGWSRGAVLDVEGVRQPAPLRSRLLPAGEDWRLPGGKRGRCIEGEIVPAHEEQAAAGLVPAYEWARRNFLGAPYQWGGVTPWGVDCSGLIQTTYAARGIALPRDSREQAKIGDAVDHDAIRPGDLLFFAEDGERITHVAFVMERDMLLHSTIACGACVAEPWGPGSRAEVLRDQLVAARRFPEEGAE